MSATTQFHSLSVARVDTEASGAIAVTFTVPASLRDVFTFVPGQFLTLRATIDGHDVRRSYSICSSMQQWRVHGSIQVGIRPVEGGVFSNWAVQHLGAGDRVQVMPPQGRFCVQRPRALHRVGFAAGSGITPILSIMASTLQEQSASKFTLVYGNRRMDSVMFNEALQDLKDAYPDRLTLIHILSRQAQEAPLLEGRIDADKVQAIVQALLPVQSMDEVFICGHPAVHQFKQVLEAVLKFVVDVVLGQEGLGGFLDGLLQVESHDLVADEMEVGFRQQLRHRVEIQLGLRHQLAGYVLLRQAALPPGTRHTGRCRRHPSIHRTIHRPSP